MKCVILAGGAGDRLWPLSRKNFPKQFMNLDGGNSLFQETITRNIPYCDKFYIVTGEGYRDIVEGQMKQFQGISYEIVIESASNGTAPALYMASQLINQEEEVLVTPADLFIQGEGYSDAIYRAKELSSHKRLVLFGVRAEDPSTIYGYIRYSGSDVLRFIEKPSQTLANSIFADDNILWNSGMLMGLNSQIQEEFKPHISRLENHNERLHIEKLLLEQSNNLSVVPLRCKWSDISNFDTYQNLTQIKQDKNSILSFCENTTIVNNTSGQLVVANHLSDAYIINTNDAIYITDKKHEQDIKSIMLNKPEMYHEYFATAPMVYRPWGVREIISQANGYRVRRLTVYAGGSLSLHKHVKRNENYSIVKGVLSVELDGKVIQVKAGESINVLPGQLHRLYNVTDENVVAIEVDTGEEITEQDMVFQMDEDDKVELPNIYQLSPSFKDYFWGGHRLNDLFGKESPYKVTAESWELSAHPDGQSTICGGVFDGRYFGDLVSEYGAEICGWKSNVFDRFPILIKFIDATNALSVQVHPFDDYAFVNENEFGKNEVWYIMDAKPNAFLYCGFSKDVTKEEIKEHLLNNTITEILNKVPVKTGDVIFVPAGVIHAIGEGLFICEIQQNSNSTYRVFDFGRLDEDGNQRELDIDKALDVLSLNRFMPSTNGLETVTTDESTEIQKLCLCKYFESAKYDVKDKTSIVVDDSSFVSIVFLKGNATIRCNAEILRANAGDSFFVPAGRKRIHIEGQCEFILTNI